MTFITENFLLQTETARRLYDEFAANCPILDFHCHLSPRAMAENRPFPDFAELALAGDHYKWRAMRIHGVPEKFCTGDATPFEKFQAWSRTVPQTVRNPLYHWTHLELLRYFGISDLLNEASSPAIWEKTNRMLAEKQVTPISILEKFGVTTVCTTDDPVDSLEFHGRLHASKCKVNVYPTFRPDAAMRVQDLAAFNRWIDQLAEAANKNIANWYDLCDALANRHAFFHANGCRLSDHGLDYSFADPCTDKEAAEAFSKLRSGKPVDEENCRKYASQLMRFFGRLDSEKGWTKQLHLGAFRNASSHALREIGRDTGFDVIGGWPQANTLIRYLDQLNLDNALPRMILYNLNPADNYLFASLTGAFHEEGVRGKIQFGSAWWFLDQKEGIEWQLNALSQCGLLSTFVGMVTDSRSFLSFPRHEYFRRILCNLIGNDVESGLLPKDEKILSDLIRGICYHNAETFLRLPALTARD